LNLAGVGFGLGAAASWGGSDFGAGIVSRRTAPLATVVLTQAIGLAGAVLLLVVAREAAPPSVALLWAAAAGAAGFVAIAALYRGLTTGPMGPIASIAAVVGGGSPTLVGALSGDQLRPVDLLGIAFALVALVLVTRPSQHASLSREGLLLALVSGVGAGVYFIALDRGGQAGGGTWWLTVVSRTLSFGLAALLALRSGALRGAGRGLSPVLILIGLGDLGGSVFFLLASGQGSLGIAAVVASQHPAVVTILARLILKERLARIQVAGIVAALVAIALIASP
jgi:drug/metabolite transporter (DMT)-like permease